MFYDEKYRSPPQRERRRDPRFARGPGADFVARVAVWIMIGSGFLGYSAGGAQGGKVAIAFGAIIIFISGIACESSGIIDDLNDANYAWMRTTNKVLLLSYFALAGAVLIGADYLHLW